MTRWLTGGPAVVNGGPSPPLTGGPVAVDRRCVSTRWRLDQSEHDTWHWRVSVRGTVAVSP
ncbi:hypothetical protein Tco_0131316, partial [Tanacetum coccineum]